MSGGVEVIASTLAELGLEPPEDEVMKYVAPLLVAGDVEAAAPFLGDEEAGVEAAKAVALALRRAGLAATEEAAATEVVEKPPRSHPAERSSSPGPIMEEIRQTPREEEEEEEEEKKKKVQRKKTKKTTIKATTKRNVDEDQAGLDETDDFASAWRLCQAEGRSWGGRGFGGRGVARRYQCISSASRDVIVDGVTLAFAGKELLQRAELRLVGGRRYALLGRNGVGKSSLLRRIATASLPGFPPHLRVGYLAQEQGDVGDGSVSALEALVGGACRRRELALEAERDDLLDEADLDDEVVAARLGEVEAELAELSDGQAIAKARKALAGVGFDEARMVAPAEQLSGGWRMRVELAAALLEEPDVLLLDEPTNHLDLPGVLWLERFLANETRATVLVVSHDRAFVEAVATDVIVFEDLRLHYFHGTLAAYEQRQEEKTAAHQHRLDARVRQETAARDAADKMRQRASQKKGANDNALRAAKQRLAKIERVGLYRDDGHRYKTHSLQKLDEAAIRLPERVEAKRALKEEQFCFPEPSPLGESNYVSLDGVDVGYATPLIKKAVATIGPGSRVAIVGDNGAGKTTLLSVLAGALAPLGEGSRYDPRLKVAFVRQHHAEALKDGDDAVSAAHYLMTRFRVSELEARSKLGKFGLVGQVAKLPLRKLSGGQKARLSLAALTWESPHLLLMDEPTNHLDVYALDALAAALETFPGAVVVVSHNRSFLAACCNELWEVSRKKLHVHRDADFSELFAAYADRILSAGGTGGLTASSASDLRTARKVHALDETRGKKGSKAPAAGGASRRAALI
ncbi:hypothetical protein CTAYLR_003285 [Chrysophaeum taylorii]|uniref:ABC transporter domain-containing protein n=1 Tax=Chrysophaeum taylorii TaxID=2483200 RepID=A0AAD7XMA4_9STRA|nr:hypothetical protein CTAYLR_003285 [Chrysophaeum taylorii]